MIKIGIYLLCAGALLNSLSAGAADSKVIEGDQLIGSYSSVTESECNIDLQLLPHGKAKIVQICRLEDGSHEAVVEETNATWASDREKITISYDSVTDIFIYRYSMSYVDFGGQGVGPGLERVGTPNSKSRFTGYGQIWKKPIKSSGAG